MKINSVISRRVVAGAAFAGMICAMACPTGAVASPLLSGYGGPGQGSQAILGSTLLNGGGGSSGSGASLTSAATTAGASGALRSRGSGAASKNGSPTAGRQGSAGRAGPSGSSGARTALYPAVEPSASTGTLGLSGQNFLLIALALAAIAVLAALTVRLAPRTSTPSGIGGGAQVGGAQVTGRSDPTMNE